jgi:hypothetical protein
MSLNEDTKQYLCDFFQSALISDLSRLQEYSQGYLSEIEQHLLSKLSQQPH